METKWIKFNGLGTEIIILASLEVGEEYLLDQAKQAVQEFEQNFSRFIKGNELDRFNSATDDKFLSSNLFVELVKKSMSIHELTNGIFDPTIIESLESVGYNKSFSELNANDSTIPNVPKIQESFRKRMKFEQVRINGNEILKPRGFRIDLGGIGKGFLADHLGSTIFKHVQNYWVSLGGDLIMSGHEKPQEQKGWRVSVQDPHEPSREAFSIKTNGKKLGIATSGIFKRKGISGGLNWNHIIDPRTGLPVENNIIAVTVITSSAVQADVLAKTVVILGQEEGLELIDKEPDSAAIIFFKEGGVAFSKHAPNFL